MEQSLKKFCHDINHNATKKGFWDRPACEVRSGGYIAPQGVDIYRVLGALNLIHEEISEATTCARKDDWLLRDEAGKPEGFPTELADAIIRIFDLATALGLEDQLIVALTKKHAYNTTRPHMHGKNS